MNSSETDFTEEMEIAQIPFKKYAIIGSIVVGLLLLMVLVVVRGSATASNSIDSRLSELKQLREDKKIQENIIFVANQKKDDLDKKIIPLKCGIFKDTGAKSTWEDECRDHFEVQKSEIQKQAVQSVEVALDEEIPE